MLSLGTGMFPTLALEEEDKKISIIVKGLQEVPSTIQNIFASILEDQNQKKKLKSIENQKQKRVRINRNYL